MPSQRGSGHPKPLLLLLFSAVYQEPCAPRQQLQPLRRRGQQQQQIDVGILRLRLEDPVIQHPAQHNQRQQQLQAARPAADRPDEPHAGQQVQRLLVNNMRPLTADDARKLYQEIM